MPSGEPFSIAIFDLGNLNDYAFIELPPVEREAALMVVNAAHFAILLSATTSSKVGAQPIAASFQKPI
jgi:hypothetical protein